MPPSSAPNAAASTADFEFAALWEARNYRQALIDNFRPVLRGSVLEVGAGIGQMTSAIRTLPAVTRIVAVEPDERFLPALLQVLPREQVVRGTVAQVSPDTGWDCLVNINVLEHIEDDAGELAHYRALLAPRGGALCLFVPARPELYAPLDRDFGHFRRYTRPGLRSKLEGAGFAIERIDYYNLFGYFAWGLSFRLLCRRKFTSAAVRFFDRFVFPLGAWMERRIVRPPFGQNLLAIARAKAE